MKPTDSLTTLFRHHLWANLRLLERCAELSDDQHQSTCSGAYGSIYDTLKHIVRSEQSYFSRISTGQPFQYPEVAAPMSIAEMAAALRTTGEGLIEWATKVQAGDTVEINWEDVPRDVPTTIVLAQALYHAAEHRSQIMTILTELGIESPNLQPWQYFDELEP